MAGTSRNLDRQLIAPRAKGTIEIELNRGRAPITVKNFVQYVNDEFFTGTANVCEYLAVRQVKDP